MSKLLHHCPFPEYDCVNRMVNDMFVSPLSFGYRKSELNYILLTDLILTFLHRKASPMENHAFPNLQGGVSFN